MMFSIYYFLLLIGDDFQQAPPPWNAPPPQIALPQMIVPPVKQVSVMPTESDEGKQKRDGKLPAFQSLVFIINLKDSLKFCC